MTEAIFGLIGVLVGSAISWLQTIWQYKKTSKKEGRYLAIRLVCILDKYLEDCADVVKDDGLSYGQRTPDGSLEAQVALPSPLIYPQDIDWKSIDHELMYQLLSFPSEIEFGNRMIRAAGEFASPPDYEEYFNDRRFYYSQFGLAAYKLSEELATKYRIKKKKYNDWDPEEDFRQELKRATEARQQRMEANMRVLSELKARVQR